MKKAPNQRTRETVPLLFPELSYNFQGACFAVRKNLGGGYKEIIYQRALAEELRIRKINFVQQPRINCFYPGSKKMIGHYRPDFIIDEKFLVELKALSHIIPKAITQIYDYLRVTRYELGYLVNFTGKTCVLKRCLLTNERKNSYASSLV